jgi:hypothetical protein
MSDVRLVGTVDDEGFAAATPYETEVLLGFIARGAAVDGVDDVEGAWEAEGVIEEWAPEGVAVLDAAVGPEWGMKEVFIFVGWHPRKFFLAIIASWNKWLTILYSL